jgi:hypothetical protein
VLLLYDNARPHIAALTPPRNWQNCIGLPSNTRRTARTFPPSDFFLFRPLKEVLGGERLNGNQQVEQFVCNWLKTQPSSFYDTGMKELPIRWKKCIQKAENYVEK